MTRADPETPGPGLTRRLAGALLLAVACSEPAPDAGPLPAPVHLELVRWEMRPRYVRTVGVVVHANEAQLSFKTTGLIRALAVDEGDTFEKGDVLGRIDTTETTARLAEAREHRLRLERDLERLEAMFEQDVVSKRQLLDARSTLAQATAVEEVARFNLRHSIIRAPFDGYVADRHVNLNELVTAGDPIFRVVERAPTLRVRAGIPIRHITDVEVGAAVRMDFFHLPEPVSGRLAVLAAVADGGHFDAEVEIAADSRIREGMVASLRILAGEQRVVALPPSALVDGDGDRATLFVARDGVAVRHEIRIVAVVGDEVWVEPTLPDGTPIIVHGAARLSDGDRVAQAQGSP